MYQFSEMSLEQAGKAYSNKSSRKHELKIAQSQESTISKLSEKSNKLKFQKIEMKYKELKTFLE